MNVSSVARQLKVTTQELLEKLPSLGFDVGLRAIKIDDKLVPKIVAAWKHQQKRDAFRATFSDIQEIRGNEGDNLTPKEKKEVNIPEVIIVKDLAELMRLPVARLMAELMRNGIMVSLNEKIDFDTASIIAEDLGFKATKSDQAVVEESSQREKLELLLSQRTAKTTTRPPVVVVMGHVDHGKTKLLDAIRETNVVDQEAGGITQHIGAYQVTTHDHLITFLDTPGHEAFKAMRSRGGQIADVAILVVAADDGLQPQTLESIAVIQKEKLPFLVAINKIDKEGADIDRVKQQLSELNLVPEDWGGKTICQPISAKQKTGINEILDLVLLVADLNDLKADATGAAVGTIIESHVDKSEGPVATVLVQAGTLNIGDLFIVGSVSGKIKTLKDWKGKDVSQALPATPIKILGLKQIPAIGEILEVILNKKDFKAKNKNLNTYKTSSTTIHYNNQSEDLDSENILNLIIKSDVLGSAEAIEGALNKIAVEGSKAKVIKKGLGQLTEADVLNAESAKALLIGFHVKVNKALHSLADDKRVTILYFDIIYKLLEDIEARLKKLKSKKTIHKLLGKLEVLAIFKTNKKSMIVGGKVISGKIIKAAKIKLLRNNEIETIGELGSLQAGKVDVTEVVEGQEAGLEFIGEPIIQVGDTLEFFEEIYE
ncbi:MAG: Translation initiation factor IF-2 [Parcubacteria group bacterium GW2011_GWA2_36_10]|nr:MAG: Translation initiation factor IF-2 [Parcubacteria group bacterium GW2011_GWA2_36_10]